MGSSGGLCAFIVGRASLSFSFIATLFIAKQRMKKRFESFLRLRYTVAILMTASLVIAVVGEISYQRLVETVRGGIALTEARIGSGRVLQLISDAESARRGYLMTGSSEYLEPLENAERELRGNKRVFEYIAMIGPTGRQDSQQIYAMVNQKLGEIQDNVELARTGDQAGALALLESGGGMADMRVLQTRFEAKFTEAAILQAGSRTTIYDALLFNRLAVLLLSVLMTVGLYWYWGRLRQLDQERQNRQQLLEKDVAHKTAELRMLAGYLQTVREDERSHLARELHDELGGLLTAAKLTLARMRAKLTDNTEMLQRIEQVIGHLNGGIALKRRIVEDLRPSTLSALGLNTALETLCLEAGRSLGFTITTRIAEVSLTPDAELGIYRIVQEALTNMGKYADATDITIELLETPLEILLNIQDNGNGFDLTTLQPGQHGLAGMRFRVESLSGSLSLLSAPDEGVRIAARFPKRLISAQVAGPA